MELNVFQIARPGVLSDPEWIALESLEDRTEHFVFTDSMLASLENRGLVEPGDGRWLVTSRGQKALSERHL